MVTDWDKLWVSNSTCCQTDLHSLNVWSTLSAILLVEGGSSIYRDILRESLIKKKKTPKNKQPNKNNQQIQQQQNPPILLFIDFCLFGFLFVFLWVLFSPFPFPFLFPSNSLGSLPISPRCEPEQAMACILARSYLPSLDRPLAFWRKMTLSWRMTSSTWVPLLSSW